MESGKLLQREAPWMDLLAPRVAEQSKGPTHWFDLLRVNVRTEHLRERPSVVPRGSLDRDAHPR